MRRTVRTPTTLAAAIDKARTDAHQFRATGSPEDATAAATAALDLASSAEALLNTPAGLLRNLLVRTARPRPRRDNLQRRTAIEDTAPRMSEADATRHTRADIGLAALVFAAWITSSTGPTAAPSVSTLQTILRIATSPDEEDQLELIHLVGDLIADLGHFGNRAGISLHSAIAQALVHFQTENDDH
ncbi:hypothetical protein [Nocardia sp. NPDC050710]|uniref:hypothetical protein n=1 Tax=Nocardia sp. NPDC050710 TaxID=3157220 RepID=UPI0033E6FFCC